MTIAEKILAHRARKQKVHAGEIITVNVDCAMMDDALGPLLMNESFERLGKRIWNKDKVIVISDHYTPAGTVEQADAVAFTRQWAKNNHISNYFEGVGPCHQILAEYGFAKPGTLLAGTDSHTCTAGAFGCFGTGIGTTEMLAVLATGEIWLRVPQTMRIKWEGKMPSGIMAKDLILKCIGDIGHDGATYMAMEFTGETIRNLPMEERMCITNMCVEAGAKTGLIETDQKTADFLSKHGNSYVYEKIASDDNAIYSHDYLYDAGELTPQIACPHNVDNVKSITNVEAVPIHRAYIGSCTGGRITDLIAAGMILKEHKVAPTCQLMVSPASQSTWIEAEKRGILRILAEAGAVILPPACGACLGANSGLLGKGENCISSSNRNFRGRMGSKDANIYLGSPATVAASAAAGHLADCRSYIKEDFEWMTD